MKPGSCQHWSVTSLLLALSLVFAGSAIAQDRHDRRDWDGRRDHTDRDRGWDRKHHWRSGDTVVDYPDYSSWHISGGLYPVDSYDADLASRQPWRRQRAAFFGHASVNLGGHTYARVSVNRNGRQYYSFRFGGG